MGNNKDYLSNTGGHTILVDQPRNKDRIAVNEWIDQGRLWL
jgi:hypothetical protein